ncbi:MAG TPA: glucosaminidase domain-containing protein [Mariprofundaceae bacterium]|nr:glucosaminidase domain-containing protein [Mariprofundaceae bacterium]
MTFSLSSRLAFGFLLLSMLTLSACSQQEDLARAESSYPILGPVTAVPDFSSIKDSVAKKKAFFDFLRPIIRSENAKVAKKRERMLAISGMLDNGDTVSQKDQTWLLRLARSYRIDMKSLDDDASWESLKRRVDTVPFRLALAQAANESSWGTSRFAREGRNFFGEWCFTEGCGMVPGKRRKGLTHEVAIFDSVNDSVASYLRSLNRIDMYKPLRITRLEIRSRGSNPSAHDLAAGLSGYSERGDAYIDDIRKMIRQNFDLMAGDQPLQQPAG